MPACPHCHHALTKPATALPSQRCPQCGARIDTAAGAASLASLLRPRSSSSQPLGAAPAPAALQGRATALDTTPQTAAAQPRPGPSSPALPARAESEPGPAHQVALTPHAAAHARADAHHALRDGAASVRDAMPMERPAATEHGLAAQSDRADAPIVPNFGRANRKPQRRPIRAWQWGALALLVATLGVQLLAADRARLVQDAYWRPVLERLCAVLGCSLPAWHQPQAYTMLARDVRPVPGAPGVLQVHAVFRNDAAWPQCWPAVAVSLSDADGRIAGARVLMPKNYLDAASLKTTVAPGQTGELRVQVREPPSGVVAFDFEFR